jgi:hypothetical protein
MGRIYQEKKRMKDPAQRSAGLGEGGRMAGSQKSETTYIPTIRRGKERHLGIEAILHPSSFNLHP